MRKIKTKKSRIIKTAVIAFLLYICFSIVIIYSDIAIRTENLESVLQELEEQEFINQEIMEILNSGENTDYILRIAREKLGFAFEDERVFIDSNRS